MSTTVQKLAAVFGVVFILAAVAGILASGGAGMHMNKTLEQYPVALGLFPVNLLHNIVHLAFGVLGLAASRSFAHSVTYAKVGGIVYLVLACLGFFVPVVAGLIPIGGNDVFLHIALGIGLAVIGFTAKPDGAMAPVGA